MHVGEILTLECTSAEYVNGTGPSPGEQKIPNRSDALQELDIVDHSDNQLRTNADGNTCYQAFLGFTPEREASNKQTNGHTRKRHEQEVSEEERCQAQDSLLHLKKYVPSSECIDREDRGQCEDPINQTESKG